MTNIEKLETAIRQALPELNEFPALMKSTVKASGMDNILEYLPTVTLIHLLRWLGKNDKYLGLNFEGLLVFNGFDSICLDLSKPILRDQDKVVINELVKLIR